MVRVFNAVALTAAYAGNQDTVLIRPGTPIMVMLDWTKGDETSLQVQVEFVHEDTPADFYLPTASDETAQSVIVNTTTTGKRMVNVSERVAGGEKIGVMPPGMQMRISAKATGGTPTGTLTLHVI